MATLKEKSEIGASLNSFKAADLDEEIKEELDEMANYVHQALSRSAEHILTKQVKSCRTPAAKSVCFKRQASSDIDKYIANTSTDDNLFDGKIMCDFKEIYPVQSFDAIWTWKNYLTVESQWFCFDRVAALCDKNAILHCTFGLLDSFDQLVCDTAPSKRDDIIKCYSSRNPSQFSNAFKSAILCFVQQEENNDILQSNDEYEDWKELVYEINDVERSYLLENKTFNLANESSRQIEQLEVSRDWLLIPLYVSNHVRHYKKELNEKDKLMLAEVEELCTQFDWAKLRDLYVKYLSQEDATLGVPEIALVAEYFGKEVIVYQEAGNVSMPFVFNRCADESCYILLTDDGHMVGLKLNTDKCRLAAYHQFRMLSLQAEFDKRKKRWPFVFAVDKAEQVIIDRIPEMAEFVKLLRPQYGTHPGVIQVLAFQLKYGPTHRGIADLKYIVQYIADCVLANRATRDLYLTLGLRKRKSWLLDVIAMNMEYCSGKIIEKIAEFKTLLGSIADINILLLFVKKYNQQDTINRLDEDTILSVLQILSANLPFSQSNLDMLASIDLSVWPLELCFSRWNKKVCQLCDTHTQKKDALLECSMNFADLENERGREVAENYFESLKSTGCSSAYCNQLFQRCNRNFDTLFDVNESSEERTVEFIKRFIAKDGNTSENIKTLTATVGAYAECDTDRENIKGLINELKRTQMASSGDIQKFILTYKAAVDLLTNGKIKLRQTQLIAIEMMWSNKSSTLVQVSTGEGKSLIISGLAVAKALAGQTVDIITSSSILAVRDACSVIEEGGVKNVYDFFDIKVSHVCSTSMAERTTEYAKTVLYGELSQFQRDYLLTTFYGKNVTGARQPENIIADEVDCMLLDRGHNILFLSHDLPGMDGLESLYVFIWQKVCALLRNDVQLLDSSSKQTLARIRNDVFYDMYGTITWHDFTQLQPGIMEAECKELVSCLVFSNVLESNGRMKDNWSKIKTFSLPDRLKYLDERIAYLLRKVDGRPRFIQIPQFLRTFVDRHIDEWIVSAFKAAFGVEENRSYVVSPDSTKESLDLAPQVIIVDEGTGVDMNATQWDAALHQFLQLKHKCKLTLQSLKAVFISNISFMKRYRSVYGLSGTLGSASERDFLKSTFSVDYVTLPTACPSRLRQLPAIMTSNEREWLERLQQEIDEYVEKQERSVLFVCDTIEDVDKLNRELKYSKDHMITYERSFDIFDYGGRKELPIGKVIIATNLAGRGTDIKMTSELRANGGLHVCLTYFPDSNRTEQQAFGRSGRKGEEGTCRMIFNDSASNTASSTSSRMLNKRKQRHSEETSKMSNLRENYHSYIRPQEELFDKFTAVFKEISQKMHAARFSKNDVDTINNSLIDNWALWLDSIDAQLSSVTIQEIYARWQDEFLKSIMPVNNIDGLKSMFKSADNICTTLSWIASPVRMIQLAQHHLNEQGALVTSELLERVANNDSAFEHAVRYYKAAALCKMGLSTENQRQAFVKELRNANSLFQKQIQQQYCLCSTMSNLPRHQGLRSDTISNEQDGDSYREQKANVIQMFNVLINSARDIIGQQCFPTDFDSEDNEDSDELFATLFNKGYLSKIAFDTSKAAEFAAICDAYGVDADEAKKLVSEVMQRKCDIADIARCLQEELGKWNQWHSMQDFWDLAKRRRLFTDECEYLLVAEDGDNKMFNEAVEKKLVDDNKLCSNASLKRFVDVYPSNVAVVIKATPLSECIDMKAMHIIEKNEITSNYDRAIFSKLAFVQICVIDLKKLDEPFYSTTFKKSLFAKFNIPESDWEQIWNLLLTNECVRSQESQSFELLTVSNKLDWGECKIYRDDVLAAICYSFCFEETRRLLRREATNGSRVFTVKGLPISPHARFVRDLFDEDILSHCTISAKVFDDGNFEEPVRQRMAAYIMSRRSHLIGLETPDVAFRSLREYLPTQTANGQTFNNGSELYVFSLNGLDDVIVIDEQRWSIAMKCRATVVIVIGLVQLAGGVMLQLYSAGFMTHVATGLSSEGVSDILYGLSALYSGRNFAWSDYGSHKLESIMFTVCMCGVAALASKSVQFYNYGFKTFGPGYSVGGREVCKEVMQLGGKEIVKQTCKGVAIKAASAIASSLVNMGIADLVESYLKSLCNQIATTLRALLSTSQVELEKLMIRYAQTKERVPTLPPLDSLVDDVFSATSFFDAKWVQIFKRVCESVSHGLAQAAEKISKAENSKIALTGTALKILNVCIKGSVILARIKDSANAVHCYTSNLTAALKKQLDGCKTSVTDDARTASEYQQLTKASLERFNKHVDARFTRMIIELTTVLLQKAGQFTLELTKQKLKSVYLNYKEAGYRREFERVEREYNERTESASLEEEEEHTKKLQELMRKTNDPELFASIVMTGRVPMDAICASALSETLSDVLGRKCVIRIKSKQGWTYCDSCNDPDAQVIVIEHNDGHFESGDSNITSNDGNANEHAGAYDGNDHVYDESHYNSNHENEEANNNSNQNNSRTNGDNSSGIDKISNSSSNPQNGGRGHNCLLDAVREQVPELKCVSNEELRDKIAKKIRSSEDLSVRIRQGWHRKAIECGFYGGQKKQSENTENGRKRMLNAQSRHMARLRDEEVKQFYNQIEGCQYRQQVYTYLNKESNVTEKNFKGKDVTELLNNTNGLKSKLKLLSHYCKAIKDINGEKPHLIATIQIAGEDITAGFSPSRDGQIYISFLKKFDNTVSHSYDSIESILSQGDEKQVRERASVILAALESSCKNENIGSAETLGLQQRFSQMMTPREREAARELIVLTHVAECASPSSEEVDKILANQTKSVSGRVGGADKLARSVLRSIANGKTTFQKAFNTTDGEFVLCRRGGVKTLKNFLYSEQYDKKLDNHICDMSDSSET